MHYLMMLSLAGLYNFGWNEDMNRKWYETNHGKGSTARITDFPKEIRTEHLPNRCQQRHSYANMFGIFILQP
jgi:hypothetical protein